MLCHKKCTLKGAAALTFHTSVVSNSLAFFLCMVCVIIVHASGDVSRSTTILRRSANDFSITKHLLGDIFAPNNETICIYDGGEIIFSNPMSLKEGDKFFNVGSLQQRAMEMMVDELNTSPHCGIRVQGKNYGITLITYGDDSSKDKALAIANYAVSHGTDKAHFLLGPYSSGLTGASVAPVANQSSKLLIAGGAASTGVFKDRPTVFGTFPPTKKYLAQAIRGLAEVGAKTIVGVWESPSFTKGVCSPLQALADENNMIYLDAIEVPATPAAEDFDPIVQNISKPHVDPDVVVTCVYDGGCVEWVQALRRADWSPRAQVFTVCIGMETFENAVGTDAEYMMGVTPWDSSLSSTDALTGWTAQNFYDKFEKTTKSSATYHAASAASALGILIQAIQKADSVKTKLVADVVARETFSTLYGDIHFDENGQSEAPSLLIQYDGSMEVHTVYPHPQKSNDLIYPLPTWSNRDCKKLSTCAAKNNTCTSDGRCVCTDPTHVSIGKGASAVCHNVPEEDYTYISPPLKVVGTVLVICQAIASLVCTIWAFANRRHAIVRASQPLFLVLVAIGTFIMCTAILPLGVEDIYRYQQDPLTGKLTDEANPNIGRVDFACMAFPWLLGIGYTITFSALFAKIWRVKKLIGSALACRRKKIEVKDVVSIMILMLAVEFVLLLAWQLVDPARWERQILTEDATSGYPTKSVGGCTVASRSVHIFIIPLLLFNGLSLFYALYLSWVTRHIPNEFSEGKWITASVVIILQLLLLGIPVIVISRDYTDAYYFVRAAIIFLASCTVTCLIFGPKMCKLHWTGKNNAPSQGRSVTISGIGTTRLPSHIGSSHIQSSRLMAHNSLIERSTNSLHDTGTKISDQEMSSKFNISSIPEHASNPPEDDSKDTKPDA